MGERVALAATGDRVGTLYVVATPIGNLQDLGARARRVLCEVDAIAAEDTRHSATLLREIGSRAPCFSLHEHNERRRSVELVQRLRAGQSIALISDAGTPLISDPGYRLVSEARRAGARLIPVPGPSAVAAALSVAGLPAERFVFEGFLPAKAGARARRLAELADEQRTLVFFEAPHRLGACLRAMAEALGEARGALVARELTKLFEELAYGTLAELVAGFEAGGRRPKGEFVIVVAGSETPSSRPAAERELLAVLLEELPPAQAARLAARFTGAPRRRLYALAQALLAER